MLKPENIKHPYELIAKCLPLIGLVVLLILLSACVRDSGIQQNEYPEVVKYTAGLGWAQTSVNTVRFRGHSIVSNGKTQVLSYYDNDGHVVLAHREIRSNSWNILKTAFYGDVTNAHNAISIAMDGSGILHMAWGMHDSPLQYVRSRGARIMEFTEHLPMTGYHEDAVSYPQFTRLPDGDLLFMYRDGESGRGDVMLNRYYHESQNWQKVVHPVIDGGEYSPYVNPLVVDHEGNIHMSWNWRASWDVATNHNLAYAVSPDGGKRWYTHYGREYELPITPESAVVIMEIPMEHDLINQASMAVDSQGNPHIATYWRPEKKQPPQFQVIRYDGNVSEWKTTQVGERKMDFSLSGGGTRRVPVSRPLLLADDEDRLFLIFRDEELGEGIFTAISNPPEYENWKISKMHDEHVGFWEPTFDPEIWRNQNVLHLLHQRVEQGQAETRIKIDPQLVSLLEWIPR